jgi:3',5'-cyclic AMP phosphodiesterase CpdA
VARALPLFILAIAAGASLPGAVLPGASPSVPPAGEAEPALFFFVHLTDPQLGFMEENRGFEKEAALLDRAVDHVNRLRPAFVVVTGDLVHKPGDDVQAKECRRILGRITGGIQVVPIPGNHDLGNFPAPASLAWFRETFGPDRRAFEVEGWRFLCLDTTILYHPRDCPDEARREKEWLIGELRRKVEGSRGIVLFQHHPWFLESPDEPDDYFGLPRALRGEFLGLLRESGVRAVFAGHTHRCALGRDGPIEMVTTSAIGKPLGKDPSGFRIVWVYRDRIAHRYYGLDRVPAEVSLAGPPAAIQRF